MITAVFGQNNSGKSEFSQKLASGLAENRYYLATMRILSDADKEKAEGCKKNREDGEFITIEQDVAIVKAIDKIKWMEALLGKKEGKRVLLLDSIPYLVSNEMFLDNGETVPHKDVESTILCGIALLKEFFDDIVIVSDEKPELSYYRRFDVTDNDEVAEYLEAMKELNAAFTSLSDEVYRAPF